MTELKTLKDIRAISDFIGDLEYKLRLEAIEWIKYIDNQLENYKQYQDTIVKEDIINRCQGLIATREWIKQFFNITEEKNELR